VRSSTASGSLALPRAQQSVLWDILLISNGELADLEGTVRQVI
jgi:hypothetical protein